MPMKGLRRNDAATKKESRYQKNYIKSKALPKKVQTKGNTMEQ